ncbi:hypothetical protein [Caulobacter sp. UC70_42]|uniref:hypothetical protein n=1 Tax=Caulobacter sp. UC70_42 TaxID=3374551 RepID=UPI003756DB7B
MASTSSVVYATTPLAGIDLDSKSSTPAFKTLTSVTGSDGRKHIYARASEALGSASTITVRTTNGSASSDAGSGGYDCNTTGGVAAGQYFWARRTSLA